MFAGHPTQAAAREAEVPTTDEAIPRGEAEGRAGGSANTRTGGVAVPGEEEQDVGVEEPASTRRRNRVAEPEGEEWDDDSAQELARTRRRNRRSRLSRSRREAYDR